MKPYFEEKGITLHQGDCLDVMRRIPDASIDACITDPPYGTTACSWDAVIPFAPMWAELKRIVKRNGAIVLFGSSAVYECVSDEQSGECSSINGCGIR